jgi:RND family efflux transporter MFP subunit
MYTGRLEAVNSVDVRSRVGGYLESVHFKEGDIVKQGDLLFIIDPRPYKAELERVQGLLATAEAKLSLSNIELARAKQLLEQKAYSQETYDQKLGAQLQAQGSLESARAAVEAAMLNLEFTRVKAPISGKISRVNITEGNLIDGGSSQSTLLTTIVSLDPIYCYFTVDERSHLQHVRLLQQGKIPPVKFPIWFSLSDEQGFPHRATIDFVDNRIDPNTATLNVRAIVPNPNMTLMPGLFVRVRVPASGIQQVLLVPDEIIMSDQAQKMVYVVGQDNVVGRRNVETGPLEQGLRVIRGGISQNDLVIINGIQRARPGQPVDPRQGSVEFKAEELIPQELRDLFKNFSEKTTAENNNSPARKQ